MPSNPAAEPGRDYFWVGAGDGRIVAQWRGRDNVRTHITRYLVGIDGEMRARDSKPDGQAWTIAIEKPVRHLREVMGVMELGDAAIATSGNYRRWVEHHGKSYAHTLSAALREPVSNLLAAVSVVAPSCMLADAWATALLVLGEKAGIELARARDMTALFVLQDGDGLQEISITAGRSG